MLSAICPECGKTLELTEEASGDSLRCPLCFHEFVASDVPVVGSTEETTTPTDLEAKATRPRPRRPKISDSSGKRRRPQRKKRSIWLLVGLVTFGVFLACGGMAVGIYFLFVHEIDVPIAASDRSLVVTAQRIAEFSPTLRIDPALETFHKVRMLDGSRELTYEYESTDGEDNILYVSHQVSVDPTVDGAMGGYTGQRIGMKYLAHRQIREVERNDLWKWGDTSKCVLLT